MLDAYRDVSRADDDRRRRVNEASAYRDRVVTEAGGQAGALRHAADAGRSRRLASASSEADTFTMLREARSYAPALTDFRLFWTTVAGTLARKDKLLLDEEPGRRRHLIVPDGAGPPLIPAIAAPSARTSDSGDPPGRRPHHEETVVKHKLRWLAIAIAVGAIAGIAFASLVVVDETEFAVVTRFGRIAAVYGDGPSEAGLHPKAPWELAIKIDRRFRVFDPPPREVMTGDKRNLEVAPYVVWRVADPVVFLQGSGSHELAEARLNERVSAGLSDAIGRRELASLASTDAAKWSLDALTRDVLEAVAPSARDELGVEVIDVRLRRFGHPVEVRPAVFDLIRSERRQVAAKLRAEGEAAVPHDHQPGRPGARHDARRGRGRGASNPRPRRGRGHPAPQRGPRPRPAVLRVPPDARGVSVHPRRAGHDRAHGVEPAAEAPGRRARDAGRARLLRRAIRAMPPDPAGLALEERGEAAMKRSRLILLIGVVLAAAIGLTATGWCMVAPGEVVVVRRLGRVVEPPWGPGLHWHFPAGIDRLDRIRTDAVRQLTIGQSGPPAADQEPSAGEVLTGDLNLLRIEATLQYRVANAVDHALRGEQADELLARAAEASLSRSLARRGVDAVLRSDRRRVAQEVQDDLQRSVDGLRLGVTDPGRQPDRRPPARRGRRRFRGRPVRGGPAR